MFGRDRRDTVTYRDGLDTTARGGISGGALATGVVVAQGAMLLLGALVAAALASAGQIAEGDPAAGIENVGVEIGIGVAVAFLLVQFLAYMWGGHTAARMARGAGLAHGLLVPLISLLLALAIGAVAAALQANTALSIPFGTERLPLEGNYEITWSIGAGVAALIAMFLGGAIGGMRGEHWHTRLERDAAAELAAVRDDETVGDVRHDPDTDLPQEDGVRNHDVTTGGLAGRRGVDGHQYDTEDIALENDRSDRAMVDEREVDLREEPAGRRDDRL